MTKASKRAFWVLAIFLGLTIITAAGLVAVAILNPFHRHEHCIKSTGLGLQLYASDNGGRFPYHTNGFGDALLMLVKHGGLGDTNGAYSIRYITGPGDDGTVFKEALKSGARVPEEKCSRIYIQGLSETNNPNIAMVFDKRPEPGGDHRRRPWGPLQREVCMVDGSMQVIHEDKWNAFANNQIELLVQDGIERSLAEHYYDLAEYKR